jgi:cellulose biosynthesis protein BcsQ
VARMDKTKKRISVLASKGGVGKSTICILLHEAMRNVGHAILIKDWDAQGTSTKALETLGDPKLQPHDAAVVIYDTPPNLQHVATATAVRESDIILVVTSPSPADIWEANAAVRFAKEKNARARIRVMVNKVRRTTILGREIEESVKSIEAPTLPIMLSARECYQHAVAQGWKALDIEAKQEVLRLTLSLLSFNPV